VQRQFFAHVRAKFGQTINFLFDLAFDLQSAEIFDRSGFKGNKAILPTTIGYATDPLLFNVFDFGLPLDKATD